MLKSIIFDLANNNFEIINMFIISKSVSVTINLRFDKPLLLKTFLTLLSDLILVSSITEFMDYNVLPLYLHNVPLNYSSSVEDSYDFI